MVAFSDKCDTVVSNSDNNHKKRNAMNAQTSEWLKIDGNQSVTDEIGRLMHKETSLKMQMPPVAVKVEMADGGLLQGTICFSECTDMHLAVRTPPNDEHVEFVRIEMIRNLQHNFVDSPTFAQRG